MSEISTFDRECPSCHKHLYYATEIAVKKADKKGCVCKSCANKGERNPNYGKPCPDYLKRLLSQIHTGKNESDETRRKKSESLCGERNGMFGITGSLHPVYGITRTTEQKQKLHDLKLGIPRPLYVREKMSSSNRRISTPETKRKQRLGIIRYLERKNGHMSPRYNKEACKYFSIMEQERKWNGIYATKNGEFFIQYLGYFVDYYEPTLNIVVEYDEPKHYYVDNVLKKKDFSRMREIMEHLKCKFYRYNERTKELKEYV